MKMPILIRHSRFHLYEGLEDLFKTFLKNISISEHVLSIIQITSRLAAELCIPTATISNPDYFLLSLYQWGLYFRQGSTGF